MSKANQKFVQADEAVSPVIGVILMVAITVVLAAVVFVLVSNLSKTSDKAEEAGIQVSSPIAGQIYVTLIKAGANAPYSTNSQDTTTTNDAVIQMDGQTCDSGATAGEFNALPGGDALWGAGETVVFDTDCSADFATPSAVTLTSNSQHTISVSVRGTVIFTGVVTIR